MKCFHSRSFLKVLSSPFFDIGASSDYLSLLKYATANQFSGLGMNKTFSLPSLPPSAFDSFRSSLLARAYFYDRAQTESDCLSLTDHSAMHSVRVVNHAIGVFMLFSSDEQNRMSEVSSLPFGLLKKCVEVSARLHDCGYYLNPGLKPYHAPFGAFRFRERMAPFWFQDLASMEVSPRHAKKMLELVFKAIYFHGADQCSHNFHSKGEHGGGEVLFRCDQSGADSHGVFVGRDLGAPNPSLQGHGLEYKEVVVMTSPVEALLRVADNLDSGPDRLREYEKVVIEGLLTHIENKELLVEDESFTDILKNYLSLNLYIQGSSELGFVKLLIEDIRQRKYFMGLMFSSISYERSDSGGLTILFDQEALQPYFGLRCRREDGEGEMRLVDFYLERVREAMESVGCLSVGDIVVRGRGQEK